MFLIDSDIIRHLRSGESRSEVKQWYYGLYDDEVRFAQITVFEQLRGIEMAEIENPRLAATLRVWWQGFSAEWPTDAIVQPDVRTLEIQARLFSAPELKNFLIVDPNSKKQKFKTGGDLILAATAIAYGIPIATLNVDDFKEINEVESLPGVFCPNGSEWVVRRRDIGSREVDRPADAPNIGEAIKRALWLPPFSSAIAEAQGNVFVELLDRLCAKAGIKPDDDVRARFIGATDRGALKRYVRELADGLDADAARNLSEHMQQTSDQIFEDTADQLPRP